MNKFNTLFKGKQSMSLVFANHVALGGAVLLACLLMLTGCDGPVLNNPYPATDNQVDVLYSSFTERPKHLDPAVAYSSNEYTFIAQIYEPPLQYHYLKRPYELIPLTLQDMPQVRYLDSVGQAIDADQDEVAYSVYTMTLKPGIRYQPHPAFSKNTQGEYLYHALTAEELKHIEDLEDFNIQQSRVLTADDYVLQIKRLADPRVQSPIAEVLKNYIVGFAEFSEQVSSKNLAEFQALPLTGVKALNDLQLQITIRGKYPQFKYWLAMPFFAPMPWEAIAFYQQPGLKEKNITLDWYPVGTGAYYLTENNPNRRMVLSKNPNYHDEFYPDQGEPQDQASGLLTDAGRKLPLIERAVFTLEKETIPYWNKFLQGYYDASGIASDSFDQAVQFTGAGDAELTDELRQMGVQLKTSVTSSIFYLGFNMLDSVVGGDTEAARKLRQAIAIAVDYEEYIAIFMNGRGIAAQGLIPPGIFGQQAGEAGMNPYVYNWVNGQYQRKPIQEAQRLLSEAGYAGGVDPKTGEALVLYFDTTSVSVDDRPRMNWYRKQLDKLGIKLVVRATDYNRFQEKMRNGNAQLFIWGWNADYPDPENFFFLLYGPNAKVAHGGENAVNYQNPAFDRLFEQMRSMDDGPERLALINDMQGMVRQDAPWLFGLHPKSFSLYHSWYHNVKPNLMANNTLKYTRIDGQRRKELRQQWNQPVLWPIVLIFLLLALLIYPAWRVYQHKITKRI
jgi:oligopeptide transport system substrate-binding protein